VKAKEIRFLDPGGKITVSKVQIEALPLTTSISFASQDRYFILWEKSVWAL